MVAGNDRTMPRYMGSDTTLNTLYTTCMQLLLDRPAALPRLLHLGISIYLDLAKADLGQNTHLALRTAGLSLTLPDMGGS
jgi:hypothetical protein